MKTAGSNTDRRARWVLLLVVAVVLGGGVLRFARLGSPDKLVPLDEQFYVAQAIGLQRHGVEQNFVNVETGLVDCDTVALQPWYIVHPPVGKWLIAAGMEVFGCSPFGWRSAAAFAGTACILLTFLIGRRLFGSIWPALLAALLVAVDGLSFVMSRLAMLDVFETVFVLLALWLALEAAAAERASARWWWLGGAGVATGLAVGSKWAAALALPGIAWAALGPRTPESPRPKMKEKTKTPEPAEAPQKRRLLTAAAIFGLLPALVYVIAYVPWFLAPASARPLQCNGRGGVAGWACYQTRALVDSGPAAGERAGVRLHPYAARAYSNLWAGRPTAHANEGVRTATGFKDEWVYGIPNPALWYPGLFVAIPLCVALAVRRRDRAARRIAAVALPLIVPWLVYPEPVFFYYMTAAMPFLALAIALLCARVRTWPLRAAARATVAVVIVAFAPLLIQGIATHLPLTLGVSVPLIAGAYAGLSRIKRPEARLIPGIVLAVTTLVMFSFLYPILAGVPVSPSSAVSRTWLQADCERSAGLRIACWR